MQGLRMHQNSRGLTVAVRDVYAPIVIDEKEYSFFGELAYIKNVLYGTAVQFWYDVARGEIILQ